jgi:wyosine [tRNA(Phe)-imidazoG37] synthetase (radical SAM superfamily)
MKLFLNPEFFLEVCMLLKLQSDIIYGPVNSRRLGRSLGINVLPGNAKVCSFDCLYCQYGRRRAISRDECGYVSFPSVSLVLSEVEKALLSIHPAVDYITFSGNGEASLHPHFKELAAGVCELRDRLAPTSRTAILSNSVSVCNHNCLEALSLLDTRIMKLDAGTDSILTNYNRPPHHISLKSITSGLTALPSVWLQSLFTSGPDGNLNPKHIEKWISCVISINPDFVQIYTLARQSPTESIFLASITKLQMIQHLLTEAGISSEVF